MHIVGDCHKEKVKSKVDGDKEKDADKEKERLKEFENMYQDGLLVLKWCPVSIIVYYK